MRFISVLFPLFFIYNFSYSLNPNFSDTIIQNSNSGFLKTYIPDDNFEQSLIDLGYDDVLDDSVLTSNIENVLMLDVSDKNISDMTGINGFSSLRRAKGDISAG